jgi:EAL domain-containing protein (putative c-di-GMP-specific phosphodiesterase class I)
MKHAVDAAIGYHLDEVGIVYGYVGGFRLKTLYQPLFERCGDAVRPIGVQASTAVFESGRPVSLLDLMASLTPEERLEVARLSHILHLLNQQNLGVEGLLVFLNLDPVNETDRPGPLADLLVETVSDPRSVVFAIDGGAASAAVLGAIADGVRAIGGRVALGGFGPGKADAALVHQIRPDIVVFDAEWFRRVSARPEASSQLPFLVRRIKALGSAVQVEGIKTAAQLEAALEAGAPLLHGPLLANPALAGEWFDAAPRPLLEFGVASFHRSA